MFIKFFPWKGTPAAQVLASHINLLLIILPAVDNTGPLVMFRCEDSCWCITSLAGLRHDIVIGGPRDLPLQLLVKPFVPAQFCLSYRERNVLKKLL